MKMNKLFQRKKKNSDEDNSNGTEFYKEDEFPTATEVPEAHSADTSSLYPPSLIDEDDTAKQQSKMNNNGAAIATATGVATATAAGAAVAAGAGSRMNNQTKDNNGYFSTQQQYNNGNNQTNQGDYSNPLLYDMSRKPVCIDCPSCGKQRVFTRVKTYPSWETFACGAGIALAFWPVFWIPLVVDSCKQTDHYCMNCGTKIGQIKPMRDCCMDTRG